MISYKRPEGSRNRFSGFGLKKELCSREAPFFNPLLISKSLLYKLYNAQWVLLCKYTNYALWVIFYVKTLDFYARWVYYIITGTNQSPAERQKDYEVKVMMKYEFEALAGYKVSDEDYNKIIEPMYMAVELNKQDFVKCIDRKRFEVKVKTATNPLD